MSIDLSQLKYLSTSRRYIIRLLNGVSCHFYYVGSLKNSDIIYLSPRGKKMFGSLVYYRTLNPLKDTDYLKFPESVTFYDSKFMGCPFNLEFQGRYLVERFSDTKRNCQYEKLYLLNSKDNQWHEIAFVKRSIYHFFNGFSFDISR